VTSRAGAGAALPATARVWLFAPAVASVLLLAAGCASVPAAGGSMLSGRLSLQVAATETAPARGVNAAFDLRGSAEAGELRLSTPLGPQMAAARWSPGEVLLVTSQGEARFPDLAALAREALGEDLPLQALPDWLRGRPWTGAASMPQGEGFTQLGWALDLTRKAEGFIIATRAQAPAVTLRIRLENP
jgi:outer membrane lipoprotein LolB